MDYKDILKLLEKGTLNKLQQYIDILLEYNKRYNIIGASTIINIWSRHIADCLQLSEYIKSENVIDIGSGGGLPGIVLAIASLDSRFQRKSSFILVEKSKVKCHFLSIVKENLKLNNISIVNNRFENGILEKISGDDVVITARAFKPLNTILELISQESSRIKEIILLKGKNYQEEIDFARLNGNMKQYNITTKPSLFSEGTILILSKKL
jgi:16S rRNA (guanine527-N7)-methyltransferase